MTLIGRVRLPLPRASQIALPILGVFLGVAIWWMASLRVGSLAVLPSPLDVVGTLADNWTGNEGLTFLGIQSAEYWPNLQYTITTALAGWLIGSALGLCVGLMASQMRLVRVVTEPIVVFAGTIPVLVMAPFFLIWFGFTRSAQFSFVAFFCFVMAAAAILNSAHSLPPQMEEYAACLGAGRIKRLFLVTFPASIGGAIGQLRLSLGAVWGLQVIAELLGSRAGVGQLISLRTRLGDVASMIGAVLLLGVVALAFDWVFSRFARRVTAWQETT